MEEPSHVSHAHLVDSRLPTGGIEEEVGSEVGAEADEGGVVCVSNMVGAGIEVGLQARVSWAASSHLAMLRKCSVVGERGGGRVTTGQSCRLSDCGGVLRVCFRDYGRACGGE